MNGARIEQICRTVACPTCRAKAGRKCRSRPTGLQRWQSHAKRQALVQHVIDADVATERGLR